MHSLLSDFFLDMPELNIRQTMGVDDKPDRSALGKFIRHTGGENPLEYEITTKNGEFLGLAQEQKGGSLIPFSIRYSFIGKRRPMVFLIKNQNQEVVFCLRRPFFILSSTTIIKDPNNQVLGYIWERFDPLYQKYELRNKNKKLQHTVRSPLWKWTFPVLNSRKRKIAMIRKKIPSLGQAMTYRETLNIHFPNQSLEDKISILATAFAICIDAF